MMARFFSSQVFDEFLLDSDPAINYGNWMWLSCSCFFDQYFRRNSGFKPVEDANPVITVIPEPSTVRHFIELLQLGACDSHAVMWVSLTGCYSPVAFPKKYDKDGAYVRHWLPQLRKLPNKCVATNTRTHQCYRSWGTVAALKAPLPQCWPSSCQKRYPALDYP